MRFQASILQDALKSRWPSRQSAEDLPIVIDVSKLKDPEGTTDIVKLAQVVEFLNNNYPPKAIGIDLDLSENSQMYEVHKNLVKWRHSNVRVGVFDREVLTRNEWLFFPDNSPMAAGTAAPPDPERAYLYIWNPKKPDLNSINRLQTDSREREKCIRWGDCLIQLPGALWELATCKSVADLEVDRNQTPKEASGEFLIDFSSMDTLIATAVRLEPPRQPETKAEEKEKTNVDEQKFFAFLRREFSKAKFVPKDRIVLIGDLGDAHDQYSILSRPRPVAGVFIQAAAVATLTEGPFRELSEKSTQKWEFILIGAVTFISLFIEYLFNKYILAKSVSKKGKSDRSANPERIEILIYTLVALCTYKIGIEITSYTSLYIPNFLWLSAALFMHPLITKHWLDFVVNALQSLKDQLYDFVVTNAADVQ